MYDYSCALRPDQVCVCLVDYRNWPTFPALASRIRRASERYGFTFAEVDPESAFTDEKPGFAHRLLLVLCDGEFDEQLLQRLCAEALGHYSVISIAFNYPDVEAMLSHAERIEHYKALSEDRINFLRPAAADDGRMVVPDDKIVDNSICDSVRVKYRPANLDRNPVALPFGAAEFFRRASELFGEHRLYHRSPSDGYFAIRAEDGSGFYITATKTYKDDLDLRRVAFVEHYDERTNTLHYRGSYLPSSDSVEAAVLLSRRPHIKSIVHTHASTRFTRNPQYRQRVLVGVESYGEPRLGVLLDKALGLVDDGFVIMEEHGEVFAADEPVVSPTLRSLVNG